MVTPPLIYFTMKRKLKVLGKKNDVFEHHFLKTCTYSCFWPIHFFMVKYTSYKIWHFNYSWVQFKGSNKFPLLYNFLHCPCRECITLTSSLLPWKLLPITFCAVLCLVVQLCPTLFNLMDCSLPGSSVHGDSPGKNTGMGCHALLQGIFPTQG